MAPTRRKPATRTTEDTKKTKAPKAQRAPVPIRSYLRRAILGLGIVLLLYVAGEWYLRLRRSRIQPQGPLADAPYTVRSVPGRGQGAFAKRDIGPGELVIREEPLFILPGSVNEDPIALLKRHLQPLTTEQQDSYFELSHHAKPSKSPNAEEYYKQRMLSIFQTNAITTTAGNVGIFPRTARLNHACVSSFNCVYSWREHEGVLVTHALKPIKDGEELTYAYFNTRRPRSNRQAYLSEQYSFNCTCTTCSLSDELSKASDERLERINELYGKMRSWKPAAGAEEIKGEIDGKEVVGIGKEIWKLADEEGYLSERGQLASDMAHVAAAHSDIPATLAWARLAEEWFSREIGWNTPQVQLMRKVIVDPRSHWSWGSREPMRVGMPDGIESGI